MIRAIVEVTTPEGEAEAFLTRPDDHSHPGVLLIMDVFGLRPTIEEMADRIAAGGYVVLEPNVFYRAGRSPVLPVPDFADPEQRTNFWRAAQPLIDQLTPGRLDADGTAYLDYLRKVASPGPVAINGYRMAAASPGVSLPPTPIASRRSPPSTPPASSPPPLPRPGSALTPWVRPVAERADRPLAGAGLGPAQCVRQRR